MPTETKVESFMEKHVNRNLLKYAAGSAIFCPGCDAILDCKRTVCTSVHRKVGEQPEECVQTWTMCGKCWDKRKASVLQSVDKVALAHPELNARLEIVDGREVFKR